MKTEKTPEQLYQEREKRVSDAIQLQVPDRVPVLLGLGYFPATYTGISCEAAYYDYAQWRWANKKTILDFEPDLYRMSTGLDSGAAFEALDTKQILWPGHGVPPNHSHQFVEGEYMKADEYNAFLSDPSDFAIRTYLPRVFGALEPLKTLPSLSSLLVGTDGASLAWALDRPEFARAFESLLKAGQEASRWRAGMSSFGEEMASLGFPSHHHGTTFAPFDVISDYLRGMRGAMIDMYRQPDNLLEACEKLLPMMVERGALAARRKGSSKRVFIPLHRGSDGFMSLKQFETFYWPTLKRLILALVNRGITPCPFFEGDYSTRLEYLLELPKGKVLCQFDATDMFRAKDVLGEHLCLMGNVPSSLLLTGTPQEVEDYCKKLIDVVGRRGGFIMSNRSSIDEAKPQNLKAMVDFTREYGVYK
jgi:hypothetical protein